MSTETTTKVEDVIVDAPVVEQTPQTQEPVADTSKYTAEEQEAIDQGWKPEAEWEGDKSDWKPAKAFLEVGKLKNELKTTQGELKKANKITLKMKEHHLHVKEAAYKEAIEQLRNERKAALEEDNFRKAEEVRDKIDDLRTEHQRTMAQEVAQLDQQVQQTAQVEAQPDPAFFSFKERNPWYKEGGANEMSREADALGISYHTQNPNIPFSELILKVEKTIKKMYPEKFATRPNPVNEPGSTNVRGSDSGGSVKLSKQELEVAEMFGMTPAEYAKELQSYKGR